MLCLPMLGHVGRCWSLAGGRYIYPYAEARFCCVMSECLVLMMFLKFVSWSTGLNKY
jgi:hypothetical protein